ncbi:hypothetical protein ACJJTC_003730 [Scirpophaga incertulas]
MPVRVGLPGGYQNGCSAGPGKLGPPLPSEVASIGTAGPVPRPGGIVCVPRFPQKTIQFVFRQHSTRKAEASWSRRVGGFAGMRPRSGRLPPPPVPPQLPPPAKRVYGIFQRRAYFPTGKSSGGLASSSSCAFSKINVAKSTLDPHKGSLT